MFDFDQADELSKLALDVERLRLLDSRAAYLEENRFLPGDIIRQKHLARIYKNLGDNDIAIVLETHDHPVLPPEYASGHDGQILDMTVGVLRRTSDDGDYFSRHYVDSRNFEPAQ